MERLMNFSLRALYRQPSTKRAKRAINRLRRTLARRFHITEENVWISPKINELIWEKGFSKVPRVLPLKIIQEEARIKVLLQSETLAEPKEKEGKKEEKKQIAQAKEKEKQEKTEKPEQKEKVKASEEEEEKKKKLEEKKKIERAAERAAIKRKLDK